MNTLNDLVTGKLKGSTKLKLSCGLKTIPEEVYQLHDTLEYLDLSGNFLTTLPDTFGILKKLRIVFFSDNHFSEFPKILAQCYSLDIIGFKANKITHIPENAFPPLLRWLILTNNKIKVLPKSIGDCTRMQKLMLAGNCLERLPLEMSSLKNLQLLRISANKLQELPPWLFSLPLLSWLAYAGNPCNIVANNSTISFPDVPWKDLVLKEQLGQGASGIIVKAHWNTGTATGDTLESNDVAVKIYKGEVTSDGLPLDEINAAIKAGTHNHLVQILGKIQGHPEGKQGLVMSLIPPDFKNLGGPPDFITCTRDVFPVSTTINMEHILSVASGIAAALEHLHMQNIMHGDLYAHNILVDPDGYPLFGDFGAATMYHKEGREKKNIFERIEVRAFGCLLEDLLAHWLREEKDVSYFELLDELQNECMNTSLLERPNFSYIVERISSIRQKKEIDS